MPQIKKIICAIDLSQHSEFVARYAYECAKAFKAELTFVYAAPALTQYVGFHVPPTSIENFVKEIIAGAEESMKEFLKSCPAEIEAKGAVLHGYAADEILNFAGSSGADLVIMGTHGRKGIDRILFGSVAERVVKAATIPVMTVRPS